jgi:hypothetical protein
MTRTEIINTLIRSKHYRSYLEIGVGDGANFNGVIAPDKTGVDPDPVTPATIRANSDRFFAENGRGFDLIFIDGLHEREQVTRDIDNSLKYLRVGGTIILHDCNPPDEKVQLMPKPNDTSPWTGDVWKAIAGLRMHRPNLSVYVIDTDWGCGVVSPGSQRLFPSHPIESLTYKFLEIHRQSLLNLVSPDVWYSIVRSSTVV